MKKLLIVLSALLVHGAAFAQYIVRGKAQDDLNSIGLSGATIQLKNITLSRSIVSAKTGDFSFTEIPNGSYKLTVSFVGFDVFEKNITVQGKNLELGLISLKKGGKSLDEVVVKATSPPAQQKGDTLQFNASQFKVNPDANVEDLVKKMPGIVVENGTLKAQGETIRKLTVDGKEFFGDDAAAALKNLPAEIVDKIQVFDRLSDQAQLTGFDDGNGYKAINITTREDKRNGQFGRVYAGYGTQDRYQGGGSVNFFDKNRRVSLIGLFNNINQQNFSGSDILGLTGGGSGRSGGAGRGGQGGTDNFQVSGKNGITTTNAMGINYSDLWGKKVTVSGSYFFNAANNENNSVSNREQFLTADSSTFYREVSDATNKSSNHRINMRLEYKIDSNNSLLIIPSVNFQSTNNTNSLAGLQSFPNNSPISSTKNITATNGNGYNLNNTILFRHAFPKKGRSLSAGITTGLNNRNSVQDVSAISTFFKGSVQDYDSLLQQQVAETNGYNLSANLSYTEPVGKKGQVQFSYNPSFTHSNADQRTWGYDAASDKYNVLDTSLSNVFTNEVKTQRGGISYRFGDRDKNFSVGLDAQSATLENFQTYPQSGTLKKSFSNLLPNAMYRVKLSQKSNLRLFYRSSTNNPSVNQLQNVINNNNTLYFTTGNPELEQSVSNRFGGRYTYTNSRKGSSLLVNFFANQADNYISNATYTAYADSVLTPTVTLFRGSQLSKPINLNGYWNMNGFVTWSFPLKTIKSNITFNAGAAYIRTPALINNVFNRSNSMTYNGGLIVSSNISQYIDFNFNYSANYNIVTNSFQENLDNNYFSQSAGLGLNLLTKNGWLLNTDVNNQLYRGLTAAFNQNFWLWNMAVGKKFGKEQKSELRLSVFDLLKQNRSISRNVTANYIEDLQTKVLTQYFMLTFYYKIKNFGKAPAPKRTFSRDGLY
ncbi:outer membrane beta-barrel protein [Flavihumibacter fluvii]|uniref:outer membrane beta-barrel protein n=1 Tax=Flavihumibacter fluvii TaxID=2838157 RepID=UPI001BDE96EF|nr:outer membrane beta-barrel protein [Flavihumibacter fluvii]ULQ52654.1 outer membrane beta-barrel protein [Flavihumibacter fluvii]